MEVLILTFLLVIIILLVKEKVVINNIKVTPKTPKSQNPNDIMGESKLIERQQTPNLEIESQKKESESKESNFETRTKGKGFKDPIPEQNSSDLPKEENIDFEAEEEEFKKMGVSGHRGYAKGVSFQELYSARKLFQKSNLEPALHRKAVVLAHKIQDTDLFSLLENSIDGSSRKIADLLNKNLPVESDTKSSGNSDNFDIGDFI